MHTAALRLASLALAVAVGAKCYAIPITLDSTTSQVVANIGGDTDSRAITNPPSSGSASVGDTANGASASFTFSNDPFEAIFQFDGLLRFDTPNSASSLVELFFTLAVEATFEISGSVTGIGAAHPETGDPITTFFTRTLLSPNLSDDGSIYSDEAGTTALAYNHVIPTGSGTLAAGSYNLRFENLLFQDRGDPESAASLTFKLTSANSGAPVPDGTSTWAALTVTLTAMLAFARKRSATA